MFFTECLVHSSLLFLQRGFVGHNNPLQDILKSTRISCDWKHLLNKIIKVILQESISNSLVSDQMNTCLPGQVYSAVTSSRCGTGMEDTIVKGIYFYLEKSTGKQL